MGPYESLSYNRLLCEVELQWPPMRGDGSYERGRVIMGSYER